MNILVTNDDGIQSPGLWALAEAMSQIGRVMVVAPDKQQSGVGASLSLHSGMDINEVRDLAPGVKAYAIDGTPNDCVILGLRQLSNQPIDFLVSGINLGPNIGRDIPYSGTVMATLQGYYRKIPSVAVSIFPLTHEEKLDFTNTAQFVKRLALSIQHGKIKTDAILNVNVPNIPRDKIKGVRTTHTASIGYVELVGQKNDNKTNYKIEPKMVENQLEEGTDIWAIHAGYISVTPLHFNITHHDAMASVKETLQRMDDWR